MDDKWEADYLQQLYTPKLQDKKPDEPVEDATPKDESTETELGCVGCAMNFFAIITVMSLAGLAVMAAVSFFGDDSDPSPSTRSTILSSPTSQTRASTSPRSQAATPKAPDSQSAGAVGSAPVTTGQVDSLYAAAPKEDVVAGMKDTEVFRRSKGFEFLTNPGVVVPGGKYTNATSGSTCSFGWIVTDGTRIFNLTAGHCGKVGDRVIVQDKRGRSHDSGQFVESTGTPKNFGIDPDFALIDITGYEYQFAPPVKKLRLTQVIDMQYLNQNEPYLCRLGWRSGLSCGYYLGSTSDLAFKYRNISDHGDSGGPVFVYNPKTGSAMAAGVTSYLNEERAPQAGGAAIKPYLDHFGLTVIGK